MDKNCAMTGKEIANCRENIRRIEELMDHPIPPGMVSMGDLSRPLSSKEIANIRENIRRVEELQFSKNRRNTRRGSELPAGNCFTEATLAGIFVLAGSIASREFTLLPLGVLLLLPAVYRIYKRFRR